MLVEKHGGGKGEVDGLFRPFDSIEADTHSAYGTSYVGDLDKWIQKTDPPIKQILKGFKSALNGLSVMQEEGVLHLDLKFQNLLVQSETPPKFVIGDFDGVFAVPK